MTSKIRIKLGPIEVEYEGTENFLKEELPQLLEAVANLHKQSGLQEKPPAGGAPGGGGAGIPQLQSTTGTIAAKLGCKTGPDLVLAAAARLTFALTKETFSRKELLEEMKTASAYHKANYVKNLSQYLRGLVKEGTLLETSKDTYSLSASKKTELGNKLA
ncbi:MAG: hypothetical protein Tsb0026_16850 [Sulfuricaulis sp.]